MLLGSYKRKDLEDFMFDKDVGPTLSRGDWTPNKKGQFLCCAVARWKGVDKAWPHTLTNEMMGEVEPWEELSLSDFVPPKLCKLVRRLVDSLPGRSSVTPLSNGYESSVSVKPNHCEPNLGQKAIF
eukprot:TRINITY_DN86535_c0_g1_i1.p1 TRINITY_DN86535_c0_g1~~TRINITY_DN86535_c0_g1_i1.p1  ORF type:complete len:126 (+),score=1.48 TRINITY_DN86535_c0_g1_i1:134-511(+)